MKKLLLILFTLLSLEGFAQNANALHFDGVDDYVPGNRYQISLHSEGRRQFYRLKMVDIDGKFTYSPVEVLQSNCAPALRIQPNPVQDQLFLYHGEVGETYLIVDMTGRKVATGVVRNNVQAISVSALPIGIYLLVVGDQRIRFLKQK